MSPATRLREVVFPHPEGPSKVRNSPCFISRDRLSRTTCPWKILETFSKRRIDVDTARTVSNPRCVDELDRSALLQLRNLNAGKAKLARSQADVALFDFPGPALNPAR